MDFNFELILFFAVLITGLITLVDFIYAAYKQNKDHQKRKIVEYARSAFPVLVLVFAVRSFAYEPYRIPTGSLKPTLLVGDFILVNKFDYGIRLPVLHTKLFEMYKPQRGDIVVFREPTEVSRNLIKRLIGLPGDRVSYKNKVLYINGKVIPQEFENYSTDQADSISWQVVDKRENLLGVMHHIYQIPDKGDHDFDVVVPKGHYFMMGDNRDDSADSRFWGFLPDQNVIGKASRILISFDSLKHPVRWERIGERIT